MDSTIVKIFLFLKKVTTLLIIIEGVKSIYSLVEGRSLPSTVEGLSSMMRKSFITNSPLSLLVKKDIDPHGKTFFIGPTQVSPFSLFVQ